MAEIVNFHTVCAYCDCTIDIEHLHWEHIYDNGETEDNPLLHDFFISQVIICPCCGRPNDVLIHLIDESVEKLDCKNFA